MACRKKNKHSKISPNPKIFQQQKKKTKKPTEVSLHQSGNFSEPKPLHTGHRSMWMSLSFFYWQKTKRSTMSSTTHFRIRKNLCHTARELRRAIQVVEKFGQVVEYYTKHFDTLAVEEKKDIETIIKKVGKMNPFKIMEEKVKKTREALQNWENGYKQNPYGAPQALTIVAFEQEQILK